MLFCWRASPHDSCQFKAFLSLAQHDHSVPFAAEVVSSSDAEIVVSCGSQTRLQGLMITLVYAILLMDLSLFFFLLFLFSIVLVFLLLKLPGPDMLLHNSSSFSWYSNCLVKRCPSHIPDKDQMDIFSLSVNASHIKSAKWKHLFKVLIACSSERWSLCW